MFLYTDYKAYAKWEPYISNGIMSSQHSWGFLHLLTVKVATGMIPFELDFVGFRMRRKRKGFEFDVERKKRRRLRL